MSDENKCFVCVVKGVETGDKLLEKQAPGIGIKGGIYICETHDKELNAKLAQSSKPKRFRRAEGDSQS